MASDSSSNQDMLNKLHDPLLLKVFSYLTFKQSAIASTISKRCLHLWRRQCPNVQFIETDFVTSSDPQNRDNQRKYIIDFAKNYIAHYDDKITLHNFSLVFSKPEDYVHEINQFVHFALSHNVNNLTLDFSDPMWSDDDLEKHLAISYTLPDKFYQLYSLESLNLVACNFFACKLRNFSLLKQLSLGRIGIHTESVKAILENCHLLQSLILSKCCMDNVYICSNVLKTLVLDKNVVTGNFYYTETPKLKLLKYCGIAGHFESDNMWRSIEEADLDFGPENEFNETGFLLHKLVDELCAVRVLKVCSFMLQVLPTGEEPIRMQSTMNVRHLILKSEIHEREYCGFKFLLASCPDLEKLTIQITPFRNLQDYEAPYYIDPVTFWTENVVVDKCVKRTLKTVEIIGYKGTWNEVRFLNYVLRFGTALSQVDLYPSRQVDDGNRGNLELYVQRAQNVRHLVMKNRKNLNVSVY